MPKLCMKELDFFAEKKGSEIVVQNSYFAHTYLFSLHTCLGTVHFLRGRGGWWDLGVGHRKKTALKGKMGGHVNFFSKFNCS